LVEETTDRSRRWKFTPFWVLIALGIVAALVATLGPGLRSSTTAGVAGALPQTGHWVPTSLHDGTTALLTLPPSTVIAATSRGVVRSDDGGSVWTQDGTGLEGQGVFALAGVSGSDLAWAGGLDGAVYARESGGGIAWRRISPVLNTDPSLGAISVYSLAASPRAGHTLLAGSQGAIFRGVAASGGKGWRWTRVWQADSADRSAAVTSLLVAPWDANLVFASIFEGAATVLVSRDGGWTWDGASHGPPSHLATQSLAPGDPGADQVFLTTMGSGVWRSVANGRWTDISAGLPQRHAMPFLADPSWGAHVYVAGTMGLGVYVKYGTGQWRRLGSGLSGASATVMAFATAGSPASLFAATLGGVYRYTS
jgi:hypothetical protein